MVFSNIPIDKGFRRITYFPDRPDVLATYTVKITGDKNKFPVLLSNGNLISKKSTKNNIEVIYIVNLDIADEKLILHDYIGANCLKKKIISKELKKFELKKC